MPANQKNPPRKVSSAARNGKSTPNRNGEASPRHSWTFLSNHAHVLIVLHSDPDQVLREVALAVGITERAVQRIVQDLVEEGYLTRERVGRRNRYQINRGNHLRHPVESHCTIDQILKLVTGGNPKQRLK